MKNSYADSKEKIISKKILNASDIFDFEHSPHHNLFENTYNSLNKILDYESKKYKIKNCFLLYLNDLNVNAKAGKVDETNLILINCGTIFWQIKNVTENENLIKYNQRYNNLFSKIQFLKFEELTLQINILFTLYHEFAHLLQKSENAMFWDSERNTGEPFSIQKHSLEIDADTFSAIHIARHLIDYYEKDFKEFGLSFLREVSIILCSNLFFYICSFGKSNTDIYFENFSHPHPFIRIIRILFTIGKYFEDDKEIGIKKNGLVRSIINEISCLQDAQQTNNFPKFKNEMVNNFENIFYYLEKLSNHEIVKTNSARSIYNKFAD